MATILWRPGIIKICIPGEAREPLPESQEPCFYFKKAQKFKRCKYYREDTHHCDFITVLPEDED